MITYDKRNKGILELLVLHLSVDIDTGEPATVSWMRVVPSNSVLQAAYLLDVLHVLNHVLVTFNLSIHSGLSALDGQGEGVHDDDGVSGNLALHHAHDLDVSTRAGVHDLRAKRKSYICQNFSPSAFRCQTCSKRPWLLTHHFDQCHGRYLDMSKVVRTIFFQSQLNMEA